MILDCFASLAMTSNKRSRRFLIPEIRFDRAVHLDGQGIGVAVLGVARRDADPALADAIFLDIILLDTLEADADVARQDRLVVIGAMGIDGEPVRKFDRCVGFVFLVHSNASISLVSASGVVVGA